MGCSWMHGVMADPLIAGSLNDTSIIAQRIISAKKVVLMLLVNLNAQGILLNSSL